MGKKIQLRCSVEEWNKIRYAIMKYVVYSKFYDNPELKIKLLAINESISEDNYWDKAYDKKLN